MTSSPRAIADELDGLITYLAEADLALAITAVRRTPDLVSWTRRTDAGPLHLARRSPTTDDFHRMVRDNDYSVLLGDGSILQITYSFTGGALSGHRLAYIPCPYEVEPDLWREFAVMDVFDSFREARADTVLLRGALRFDYAPHAAGDDHPAAHLTLNQPTCRMAVAGPLRLGEFVDFVFRHFYPETYALHPFLSGMTHGLLGENIIDAHRGRLHVACWGEAFKTSA